MQEKKVNTVVNTTVVKDIKPITPKRTEILIAHKPRLILSDELVSKITTLHEEVQKGIEWSAILLYSNKVGNVDTPENWIIDVHDLILMDIGSSGYTEYDIDASDTYASEKWMDALEAGVQMGQIHSHHQMNCFFSGTDSAELHDNAPHHAYYLSLIVNYKSISEWCAKIGICGEEEVVGETTTKTSWRGAEKMIEKVKSTKINEKKQLLYVLDCKLETPVTTIDQDDLKERIKSIVDKKTAIKEANAKKHVYTPAGYAAGRVYTGQGSFVTGNKVKNLFSEEDFNDVNDDFDDYRGGSWKKPKQLNASINSRVQQRFSPKNVEDVLVAALTNDEYSTMTVGAALMALSPMMEEEEDIFFVNATDKLNTLMASELKALDKIDRHCVAVSMYELLSPCQGFSTFPFIDDVLIEYLLEEGQYTPAYVKMVTGIEIDRHTTLDSTPI